ncbi:MAG: hypothetical protein JNJ54_30240 [Myxococcaceae bacterium]|nr:hypothetical protein [Myxococcaceae bacterium]
MRLRTAILLWSLSSCGQASSFAREPAPPTGRVQPGLERCSNQTCAPDAGSCFTWRTGEQYCTGANDRSACDVIACDAPARCLCLLSLPPQCGCGAASGDR